MDIHQHSRRAWFPFTAREVEIALAAFAFCESILFLIDVERDAMAWFAGCYVVFFYVVGLIVDARRNTFEFIAMGAVGGRGYLPYIRRANKSLLLLHTDDDPPCEELLGLYRSLLDRGVEIRRVLFLRPERERGAYAWVESFGTHAGLEQRVVAPERAALMRHSFVVVDERTVLLSVPGGEAIDGEEYSKRLVLKHLLAFDDQDAAQAFSQIYGQLWSRAEELSESNTSRP